MALWGNKDSKSATGTIAIADTGVVTGSSTLFTTEAKIGNTIRAGGVDYQIVKITSNTACTVKSGIHGGAIAVVNSGASYTLSEKTAYVAAAESAGSASGVHGNSNKVFGVDVTANGENYDSAGRVIEVGVAVAGSGYVEAPGVTFTGGGGSGAAATATISGGVVTSIAVTNNGSSYENVPTVVIQVPVLTVPTAGVNTTTEVITYTAHGQVTGDALTYNNGGGTSITGLTSGTTYYVSKLTNDTFKLYDTAENATAAGATGLLNLTGTGNDAQSFTIGDGVRATAVAAVGGGTEGEESRSNIAHAGWIRRTVGTGGRAGRVHLETLVAMGSMTGDQADDRQFTDD
jgi:hypothetical protein